MPLDLGISLPSFGSPADGTIPDLAGIARHAETLGLDTVWVGDHLNSTRPFVESTLALATAAAATRALRLGFGVLQLGLRHQPWIITQLASLQRLSGGRLALGVGAGGVHPGEWAEAGIPLAERGQRTDAMLDGLGALFSGETVRLNTVVGTPEFRLPTAVPVPPLWIGGVSPAALRRTARYHAGWLSSLLAPDEFARRAAQLREHTGTAHPRMGTTIFATMGMPGGARALSDHLTRATGTDRAAVIVDGGTDELADWLDRYQRAGAEAFIVATPGIDYEVEHHRVAEVRRLLAHIP